MDSFYGLQLYHSLALPRAALCLYPLLALHRAALSVIHRAAPCGAPFVFHLISLLERDVLSRETYCNAIIRFHLITITLSVVVNIVVIATC